MKLYQTLFRPRRLAIAAIVLVGIALPTSWLIHRAHAKNKAGEASLITETVKRLPLRVTVANTGVIDSQKSVTLVSEVEYRTNILSIVDEGTWAKKGDILCELDSASLEEQLDEYKVLFMEAESLWQQAQQDVEIQKTQNESNIAAAELKLRLDELDLQKYQEGDYPLQQEQLAAEIQSAEEAARRSRENFDFRKRQTLKGYYGITALEADQSALSKTQITLKIAEDKRRVLQKYTAVRNLCELKANVLESERQLERVRHRAAASLLQSQVRLNALQRTVQARRTQVNRMNRNIAACTIRAPQDGEVVYSNRRNNGNSTPIAPGLEIQYRQEILKLPDLAHMKVDARIHESRINLVREGLPVKIKVDALPDRVFHGSVQYVSTVPLSGNWPNFDLKEYEAVISVDDYPEEARRLKPGLTAHIEIEIDERNSVLQVPVQAVVELSSQHYSCVLTEEGPELRPVQIGQSNDITIEILNGIAEGENVVLNVRTEMAEELGELAEHQNDPAASEPITQTTAIPRVGTGG